FVRTGGPGRIVLMGKLGLSTLVMVTLLLGPAAAGAQPGQIPPGEPPPGQPPPGQPPPGQPYPPPPAGQWHAPPPGNYHLLTMEERELLARGEIDAGPHIAGGVVSMFIGFGAGHAVQGRFGDTGWIFLVGEVGSILV